MAERYFTSNSIDDRDVVISISQMRDQRLYERLRAEAQKRGKLPRIISDAEFSRLRGTQPEPEPTPERSDDGTIMINGRRSFPIRKTDAAILSRYEKYRSVARDLDAELRVVPDNFFDEQPPPRAA